MIGEIVDSALSLPSRRLEELGPPAPVSLPSPGLGTISRTSGPSSILKELGIEEYAVVRLLSPGSA